ETHGAAGHRHTPGRDNAITRHGRASRAARGRPAIRHARSHPAPPPVTIRNIYPGSNLRPAGQQKPQLSRRRLDNLPLAMVSAETRRTRLAGVHDEMAADTGGACWIALPAGTGGLGIPGVFGF